MARGVGTVEDVIIWTPEEAVATIRVARGNPTERQAQLEPWISQHPCAVVRFRDEKSARACEQITSDHPSIKELVEKGIVSSERPHPVRIAMLRTAFMPLSIRRTYQRKGGLASRPAAEANGMTDSQLSGYFPLDA